MVWLKTKAGKSIPVDAATVTEGDTYYKHGAHISHFATCKFAEQFRKAKK
jgi:hypothetical protein